MTPTPSSNGKPTPKTNTTPNPAKQEAMDPSSAPTTQATEAPTPKEETRPFTLTVPVRTLKLLSLISKVEGKSTSEIVLDAIEKSGLKDRARAALASLANDLGE